MKVHKLLAAIFLVATSTSFAQAPYRAYINEQAAALEQQVVSWRRHLHQYPELSNREFKTATYVTSHLSALGLEVRTGVAHTGVVGILRGAQPGPVVALRADMDALPVAERVDLPFASREKSTYLGAEVGVMHACGHDTHVAMLMGAAQILSGMRDQIKGTVVFIFQPAEEGAPPGEQGGAKLMVEQGVLDNPKVDAIFGIHINSQTPVGTVRYKPGGTMAAVNAFTVKIRGKQAHGSAPWGGIDPITIAAQVIQGFQHIVSRQVNITNEPAVISIGKISGGVRSNIIPEEVELIGTIRTLDKAMQQDIHQRIISTASNIAEAWGAQAEVIIEDGYPVTYNDPNLTNQMLPTLQQVAGADKVVLGKAVTGSEDFSFFAEKVPGLFVFLGGMAPDKKPEEVAPHHTPDFYIDESGMKLGVEVYCNLALDYLLMTK